MKLLFNNSLYIIFLLLLSDPALCVDSDLVLPGGIEDPIKIVELRGEVLPEDQFTYRLVPFFVPEGIGSLHFSFEYTGHREFAEIEIGVFDPTGFRGTSRFSKTEFYVGKYQSTASYFPGLIPEGVWNISLGFPTIKQDSDYLITVRMIPENHPEFYGPDHHPYQTEMRWYAGDFHTHTGHSDAFGCLNTNGERSPCQVYQVAEAAHRNGLEFISVNDHNTISHHQDIHILQPTFPDLLLIKGQETTTFYGHMNVHGTGVPIDFRIGFDHMTIVDIQEQVESLDGLFSINHPGRETGAACTGCGWSAEGTDYNLVDAVEIVNGTNVETGISGIPFWHRLLNEGYIITGIGGSDDHGAGFGSAQPGTPTTMVYAHELSEVAILNAVKKGRVYLKARSVNDPEIEFSAESGDSKWRMGDVIAISELNEQVVTLHIQYSSPDRQDLELISNGEIVSVKPGQITTEVNENNDVSIKIVLENQEPGWVRFNLRDREVISVISNPIYFR